MKLVALAVVPVALVTIAVGAGAAPMRSVGIRVACVSTGPERADAPERALAAARAFLRHMTITNQSGNARLTPGNYRVSEVISLSAGTTHGAAGRYFRAVRQHCGDLQAERTWLVVVDVVAAQLPMKPVAILDSPTKNRWRVTFHSGLVAATR